MNTESLVKLADTGNVKGVEEAWLTLLEDDSTPEQWSERAQVLKTFVKNDAKEQAEALAGTALESLTGRLEGADLIRAAGALLMPLKDSTTMRGAVGALYREVYPEVPGLEELLSEAGVEGGRPPRRALRTMDVGLQLEEGLCLAHRHEDRAARVVQIDREAWQVDVETGKRTETLGVVELADNYRPADGDDFRVMAQFHPDRLIEMLRAEPGRVVSDILRAAGPRMTSDELKNLLSPRFLAAKEWTKWWTKARQALRVSPHVKIEGRNPYFLTYDSSPATFDDETRASLAKAHDAQRELDIVEDYVRGSKLRNQKIDLKILEQTRTRIEERAREGIARTGKVDLTPWLAARRIGTILEDENAFENVIDVLNQADDPAAAILAVENHAFWPAACEALERAHPDNLAEALERLLPHAPIRVADHLASCLVELGYPTERFRELAEQILRDPVHLNEGLLWLWNGPSAEQARVDIPLATILTRLLYALGEVRLSDNLSRAKIQDVQLGSRDVLKARKYARFQELLEQIEPGVAMALRTQITRLDNLGRVSEDMLRLLRAKFPQLTVAAPTLPKWLRDDVLYVTDAGHERKHAEIEDMVNVKMRENAIAIGAAAELGDLSENSEYKFALEERDLLQARLAQMQREMDMAQILRPEDVPGDHVGIGCCVVLEHVASNTRRELTILSAWEANPDKGVYNYHTPVAQSVLGTKVGETATIEFFDPSGEYRVVEVRSVIEK